jgi:hypothetical protein
MTAVLTFTLTTLRFMYAFVHQDYHLFFFILGLGWPVINVSGGFDRLVGNHNAPRKSKTNKEELVKDIVENYKFCNLFDYFDQLILILDAPQK